MSLLASDVASTPPGAGKTHTMYGSRADPGLAPRAIHEVFKVIQKEPANADGGAGGDGSQLYAERDEVEVSTRRGRSARC